MNFTSIDFETANHQRSSACSIGIVIVKDGKIVEKIHHLIKPSNLYFHPMNISIHGIRPEDVKDALNFGQLWPEIEHYFNDKVIIAHNAPFDLSVLKASLSEYGIDYPNIDFACTVKIAKKIWTGLENHKLNTLAYYFDLEFKHHDALDDAIACSVVAINSCKETGTNCIHDLCKELDFKAGRIKNGVYKAMSNVKKN